MTFSFRRILGPSLIVWVLLTALGVYFLANMRHFISFGIDLVGGTYITLDVKTDKAIENDLLERARFISGQLKRANLSVPTKQEYRDEQARMVFDSEKEAQVAEQFLLDRPQRVPFERRGASIILYLLSDEKSRIASQAIESNIRVLRTRLDQFGAGEITIAPQGERSIIIELPDVHNPQQAKAMIGRAALLEIKLVEDSAGSQDVLLDRFDGQLPDGMTIVPDREGKEFYLVEQYTDITGKLLKDARMTLGGQFGNQAVVNFTFKPEGGERFYELTSENIGRRAAIVMDNVVISAPVIQAALSTDGVISGNFTPDSAQELATLLRSGAFAAPVSFEEERHIGPALGHESIRNGLLACLVGLALLFVFSLAFYRLPGLFAFIVLLYNLLVSLALLSWLGATLTLPGIAGMILTIGMAIDASILIYERIREELLKGSALSKAITTGFSGATAVILDANITHFIVSFVLYKLGAGPVQGFAITMIVGIVATLFTGLVLLRSIFTIATHNFGIRTLKF